MTILRRYAVPAVVFVWSDPVEQRRLAWYAAVARQLGEPEVERLKTVSYEEWRRVCERHALPAEDGDPCAPVSVVELAEALEHSRFVMLRGVSAGELGHRLAHSWRH